jgi:hypothetical protein
MTTDTTHITKDQTEVDYEAGAMAAKSGVPAASSPFTYAAVGKPSQEVFDKLHRPRLNAWMQGWMDNAPPRPIRKAQGGTKRKEAASAQPGIKSLPATAVPTSRTDLDPS